MNILYTANAELIFNRCFKTSFFPLKYFLVQIIIITTKQLQTMIKLKNICFCRVDINKFLYKKKKLFFLWDKDFDKSSARFLYLLFVSNLNVWFNKLAIAKLKSPLWFLQLQWEQTLLIDILNEFFILSSLKWKAWNFMLLYDVVVFSLISRFMQNECFFIIYNGPTYNCHDVGWVYFCQNSLFICWNNNL